MRDDETRSERLAAKDVLQENRLQPVMFEDFKGQFYFDQEAEALRHLAESDALLLILNNSMTNSVYAEFYAAASDNKPIWIFLRETVEALSPELQDFIRSVARKYRYDRYTDLTDLKFKLRAVIQ